MKVKSYSSLPGDGRLLSDLQESLACGEVGVGRHCVVLCDGCLSCPGSGYGAKLISGKVLEHLRERAEMPLRKVDWVALSSQLRIDIVEDMGKRGERFADDYQTTILGVVSDDMDTVLFSWGNGVALVNEVRIPLPQMGWSPWLCATPRVADYVNPVSRFRDKVKNFIWGYRGMEVFSYSTRTVRSILLATDGLEKAYRSGMLDKQLDVLDRVDAAEFTQRATGMPGSGDCTVAILC